MDAAPVPHSAGTRAPSRVLPAGACDCHMHVFDPRFAASPHWPRTPPRADVAAYRLLQRRLGLPDASVLVLQGIAFVLILASEGLRLIDWRRLFGTRARIGEARP